MMTASNSKSSLRSMDDAKCGISMPTNLTAESQQLLSALCSLRSVAAQIEEQLIGPIPELKEEANAAPSGIVNTVSAASFEATQLLTQLNGILAKLKN